MPILIAQVFKHIEGGGGLCGLEGGGGCLGNRNGAISDIRKQVQKPHATEKVDY